MALWEAHYSVPDGKRFNGRTFKGPDVRTPKQASTTNVNLNVDRVVKPPQSAKERVSEASLVAVQSHAGSIADTPVILYMGSQQNGGQKVDSNHLDWLAKRVPEMGNAGGIYGDGL